MKYACSEGCTVEVGMSERPPGRCIQHGSPLRYTKALGSRESSKPTRRRSTLKPGRGFSASKAQRTKIRDLRCVVSGQDRYEAEIHPAHLWDRGRGGCDDPLCVVPLRADLHRLYDRHELDLLPHLLTGGYWREIAHIIEAHEVSPTVLLERLTGQRWQPRQEAITHE